MTGKRGRLIVSGWVLVALLLPGFLFPAALAGSVPQEADIKAAFLLNFIKFVEWPGPAFHSEGDPYLLFVVGDDPAVQAIEGLDNKMVAGRRLVVRKVSDLSSLKSCHVLFVGKSQNQNVVQILGVVKERPVLTVADFDGFARKGGTIGFIREHDRIRFEINEESATKAGLKVNAKLLYLGKIVQGH